MGLTCQGLLGDQVGLGNRCTVVSTPGSGPGALNPQFENSFFLGARASGHTKGNPLSLGGLAQPWAARPAIDFLKLAPEIVF